MFKYVKISILVICLTYMSGMFSCSTTKAKGNDPVTDESIAAFEGQLSPWKKFKHHTVDINFTQDTEIFKEGNMSMKIDYTFHDNKKMFVAFLIKDLGRGQDWSAYDAIGLWSNVPERAIDLRDLSVMVYEEDGSAYIAQNVRDLRKTGWERARVTFSNFIYSSGGRSKNKESKPDLKQIRKISFGIFQPVRFEDKSFSIYIDDIRLLKEGDGDAETASDRQMKNRTSKQDSSLVLDAFDSGPYGWGQNIAPTITLDASIDNSVTKEGRKSLKMEYHFKKNKPFWGYLVKDLGSNMDWKSFDSLAFWSYIPESAKDLVELSVMLYEEDGSAYIAQQVRGLKTTGWEEIIVPFTSFFLAGEWTKDENDTLDMDQIRKVGIGIWQPGKFSDKAFTLYVNYIRAVKEQKEAFTSKISKPVVRTGELQKHEPPDGQVYHGVVAFDAPQDGWGKNRSDWENQIDPEQIAEYEKLSGGAVVVVTFFWFFDWGFPTEMCESVNKLGKIPHLTVISGGIKTSDIVKGKMDKKIRQWAEAAKNYGKPLFFRFFHEMNGNWNIYSQAKDPSQTQEMYIKAWRRVVNSFRNAGADNVIWVWAPTAIDVGRFHWTGYYPGDAYVDWVGVSVYNFLGNGDPEQQIMGIYNDYAGLKPIMIAESGAGDADNNPKKYRPGNSYRNNPEKWINTYFDTMEQKATRVKAFVWFNIDRERVWKIQESPVKIKVFKKRLRNKRYGAAFKQ
jgi:hypothetical protein